MSEHFEPRDPVKYFIVLAHDEYIGSVLAGHEEDYAEWTDFMGKCLIEMAKTDD